MIAQRISTNSSSKKIFDEEIAQYKNALTESGYTSQIQYKEPVEDSISQNRARKVMYFNPPFCKSVKTKVGRVFRNLVEKHFANSKLTSVCNKNNLKISYCKMSNMKQHIDKHNNKIIKQADPNANKNEKDCICRKPVDCPMDGKCAVKSVVYQAKVVNIKSRIPDKFYYGSSSMQFKQRYDHSFKNENANPTGLSKSGN